MIYQTARYRVRPEGLEKGLAALDDFTRYVAKSERGTLLDNVYRNQSDPLAFLHVIHFADEAAHNTHGSSPAVREFQDRLYPQLEAPVVFDSYEDFAITRQE